MKSMFIIRILIITSIVKGKGQSELVGPNFTSLIKKTFLIQHHLKVNVLIRCDSQSEVKLNK